MRTKQLRTLAVAALAVAAVSLAACSSGPAAPSVDPSAPFDEDALVAAAKAENCLTFYGDSTQSTLQQWAAAFTDEYGIPVTIVRNATGPLYQQFAQEAAAGQAQADIVSVLDHSALDQAIDAGWIAQYTPQEGDKVNQDFSRPGYYYADQSMTEPAIAYNTNNVSPDQVAELKADPMGYLADASLKGKIGIVAPQAGMQLQAFWYLYSDGPEAGDYGWDTLDAIGANAGLISDTVTVGNAVVQGEMDYGLPLADTYLITLASGGAPIGIVYPDPTVAVASATAIAANAPCPNAARLFQEWAVSKAGVQTWTDVSKNAPMREDVTFAPSYEDAPWFVPQPADPWLDYSTDQEFLDSVAADGDYYDKWNAAFGYSG